MYNKSLNTLFMFTLVMGILLMITSKTWFSAWLGLEINLLSFLPIILLSSPRGSEGGLKYFLIQALASLIILQTSFSWFIIPLPALFLMASLSLKLGMAPLHFWLPDVTKSVNWTVNMILLTIQKVGPLYLLSSLTTEDGALLTAVGVTSVTVGALGGMNELDARKLMAFSSISHMGWMAIGTAISSSSWVLYLLTYIMMALTLMGTLKKMHVFQLSQLSFKGNDSMFVMILLLSMGGFPPFLGFAPKWAILIESLDVSLLVSLMLVSASVVTLYYYIRAGLAMLVFSSLSQKTSFPTALPPLYHMLLYFNVFGGGMYMFMWSSLVL
uniref:NADH-ubiquinone oxidoreductase chain 2 n=1 Tax=Proasellus hercegovinensis TaxID=1281977 RepID=A0A485MED4_9CRUS|nr:NADH dehydrogenase subunit 2 [Proasellus hercegovinensis]